MECEGQVKDGIERGTYVRILGDDGVQPLELCGTNGDGLCTLDAFVEIQGMQGGQGW